LFELGGSDSQPEDLSQQQFRQFINTHGVLKIRDVSESRHRAITDRFGCNWSNFDWAQSKPWRGGPINKTGRIESAAHAVPPHSEYSGHPAYPQLLWMYCVEPAKQGGETFVYDGMAVAREMPAQLRELFSGRTLKNFIQLPLAGVLRDYAVADVDQLQQLIRDRGWEVNMRIDETLVTIEREWPAFAQHAESGEDIFCNSIVFNAEYSALVYALVKALPGNTPLQGVRSRLFSWLNRLPPKLLKASRGKGYCVTPMFKDGSMITRRTVQELSVVLEKIALPLDWRPGDLVAIDNHRFMHGRGKTELGPRKLVVRAGDHAN